MSCSDSSNSSNHFQRLSYSVFLSDSFFQPKNRSRFKVASIIVAPRFRCGLENFSVPIQTTFKTIRKVNIFPFGYLITDLINLITVLEGELRELFSLRDR